MAEAVKAAAARQLPAFKLGKKQVFLPSHVITMLRKEHLPPNEACFKVPLRFTKFDLRDYLWNLYGVQVAAVRSYVKQQPLTQRSTSSRAWYRPQPQKVMTVELAAASGPFQWPDAPADLEPWSHELWRMREDTIEKRNEEQLAQQRMQIPLKSRQPVPKEREQLGELAKKMLSGEVKWENNVVLDPRWDRILGRDKPGKTTETTTTTTS